MAVDNTTEVSVSYAVEEFGLANQKFRCKKTTVGGTSAHPAPGTHLQSMEGEAGAQLVSFDLKGAYNGVYKERLLQRLSARIIPTVLIRRVNAFCSNRTAFILVNGEQSESRVLLPR